MTDVALHADDLNIISLCSGGGGLDVGFELAFPNARPVVLVEGEAFGAATLVAAMQAHLLAPAPVWSDVRTFDGRPWRGLVDGIIGGIPCQPHSLAGRRKGAEDERDLWSTSRRIIVQARPWFVGIENVRGFVSSGGLERVWRDLRRLGYTVEVGLFTAAEVGATHERERCFVLAVADFDCGGWRSRDRHLQARQSHPEGCRRSNVGHPDSAGLEGRRHEPDGRSGEWAARRQNGGELVNAASDGRREGWPQPEVRAGRRDATDSAGAELVNPLGCGHDGQPKDAERRSIERTIIERAGGSGIGPMGDANSVWQFQPKGVFPDVTGRVENASGRTLFPDLSPPRPSDLDGWRRVLENSPELEPAVRRMADGVAARLDLASHHTARIDRIRQLGNGVHPLQAAYAFQTLATRLAGRGIAGAAELVRMTNSVG